MENEITRVESLVANQGLAMAIAILLLVAFIFLLGFAVNEFKKSREESKIVREQERERDEKRHEEYIDIIKRTTKTTELANTNIAFNNDSIKELMQEFEELKLKLSENGYDNRSAMSEIKIIVENIERIIREKEGV